MPLVTEPTLRIRLLGSLDLACVGVLLPLPASAKARSLLAFLVTRHGRPSSRDRLVGTFWPERPDARARRALSHALWQIRTSLDAAAGRLVTDGHGVAFVLQPGDWIDVDAFERLLDGEQSSAADNAAVHSYARCLCDAVELYRGDLLEDVYDDWVLVDRERLREGYLRALERLIALHKQQGDYEQALVCAQRLSAADPLREEAHRDLMRLYYLVGRPRAALEQFATLRERLAKDLRISPAPSTVALYQEVAAALEESAVPHLPAASPPPPLLHDLSHLPLVGRHDERVRLLSALQAAVQGHGGQALVEGDAGVGKSRLVNEVVADARWRGFQVGVGTADQRLTSAPCHLLRSALLPLLTPLRIAQLVELVEPQWLAVVAPLFPRIGEQIPRLVHLAPLQPREEQHRLCEGVARCLSGLTAIAPLLLLLEDVQWADDATLNALLHLAPRLAGERCLLILTCRTAEARARPVVWQALDGLDGSRSFVRLSLAPFTPAESEQVIRRALGVGQTDPGVANLAQRLQDETQGNVLFLLESLKSLLEQGALAPSRSGWTYPPVDHPLFHLPSVQALVGERLRSMSTELRNALELVAVLGEDADFSLVVRTVDRSPADLAARLETLCQRGFLSPSQIGYRFEHDLVRDAVYQAMEPTRKQALHRRAGDVLQTLHPERVESLALHFCRGGEPIKALAYALQAGERAQAVGDYEAALAHYRRAALLVGDEPSTRWDVLARQERALYVLTRWDAQAAVLDEMSCLAETLDDDRRRSRTLLLRAVVEEDAGDPRRALSLLEKALGLACAANCAELQGEIQRELANVYWRLGDVVRCQTAVGQAREFLSRTGDLEGERRLLNTLGRLHLGLTGDYGQALVCYRDGLRISRQMEDDYACATSTGNVAITHALLGDYATALQLLAQALPAVVEIGDRHTEGAFHLFESVCHRGLGDLDRAARCAQYAVDVCRQVGNPNFEIEALGVLGQIALDRDDAHQAVHWFDQAVRVAEENGQALDSAEQRSHLALARSRLEHHEEALRFSAQALADVEQQPDAGERLKMACFERAQIESAARGAQAAQPYLERAYDHLLAQAERITDPDLRRSFLEDIPLNRDIAQAHHLGRVSPRTRRVTVRLACADAPLGRRLCSDEWVDVTWTVETSADDGAGGRTARRRCILHLLQEAERQSGSATVADLASVLGVSKRTVKRDLAALRAEGHAVRTRGTLQSQAPDLVEPGPELEPQRTPRIKAHQAYKGRPGRKAS